MLRIIINPATGETKFAFVNSPDINYTLDGLIGIGLETIRENIDSTIEETIVLPNTLTFQFYPPTSPVQQENHSTNNVNKPANNESKVGDGLTESNNNKKKEINNEFPPENEFKWHILGIIAGFIWSKTDVSMIFYLFLVALVVFHYVNKVKSRIETFKNRKTIQKHEIHAIHARLNGSNPPSWVSYPDWERCEWMNKIIKHLWGRGCEYTSSYVRYLIESYISENLQQNNFKLDHFDLGYVPLRIDGTKVYKPTVNTKMSKDEIIIDLDVYYVGDSDIRFKINGAAMCSVKNIQVQGVLRLVVKHVSVQPLIISLEIYFLNKPNLNFELDGVACVLNLPAVKNFVRKLVQKQLGGFMVLPEKLTIELINYEAKHLQDFSWYVQLRR